MLKKVLTYFKEDFVDFIVISIEIMGWPVKPKPIQNILGLDGSQTTSSF